MSRHIDLYTNIIYVEYAASNLKVRAECGRKNTRIWEASRVQIGEFFLPHSVCVPFAHLSRKDEDTFFGNVDILLSN
jgi:hypothetical protein